jgi:hypothetical protein
VRILCRSIRQHHPEAVIHLALADERPKWLRTETSRSIRSSASSARHPDYRNWTFTHSIVELSTAIKPFALKQLLQLPDCGTVLYFRSGQVLFSRVDDILETLRHSNLALTPHQTKPGTDDGSDLRQRGREPEARHLQPGLHRCVQHRRRRRFADWWSQRTYSLCWADVENGLFTDQKWVNFAPVFFDGVSIVKSSRHNVATWNLTTRRMTGSFASGFEVDGEPLGFYHFTGFDSGAHRIMAIKNAQASPAVQALISWYEARSRLPIAIRSASGRGRSGVSPTARRSSPCIAGSTAIASICEGVPRAVRRGESALELPRLVPVEGVLRHPEWFGKDGKMPRSSRPSDERLAADGAAPLPPRAVAEEREGAALPGEGSADARRTGGVARRLHGPR